MTLPNGLNGISEAIGTLFASGGPLTPVPNAATWGTNPISGMNTLTQSAVTEKIKQNQILNSTGWNATTSALYEGLRRGNPTDGNVPLITSSLEAMVNKLFGTTIHFPSNAEVIAAIERVPLMTDLIEALQSIYKGLTGQESLTNVLADLNADIQSALHTIQSNTNTLLTQVLDDLGLPTTEASAFAAWLSGSAAGQRITNVSSAVVVNGNQQLLDSPNFSGAISIAGNGIWTLNSSIYYIIPGETVDEPGSAQITANGTQQVLTSTPAEDIPLGQPVDYSVHVCASGLTGSGTLLQLVAVPWIGDTAQTPIVLASSGVPTGATTGWTNPPAGSTATVLSGVYTPATGSGITAVSMQLVLTNAALSGTVYWSAASEELTGGLINDLVNENAASQQASANYWTSMSTAVNQALGGNWSGGLTTAENAWQTYQTAQAGVASAQYVTLHQLLSMVGINTGNGMMAANNVANVLGQGNLGADIQAILDYLANALGHTGTGHSLADIESYFGIVPSNASSISTNQTWLTQISQIVNGQVVTPINTAVTQFKTWWTSITGGGAAGTVTATAIAGTLPPTQVGSALGGTNLGADVSANNGRINNTWSWLFGTTTPPPTPQVLPTAVGGVGGQSSVAETLNAWAARLGAALGGNVADAGDLAGLAQLMNDLGVKSSNTQGVATSSASTLAIRTNSPTYAGHDNTSQSNMTLTGVNTTTPISGQGFSYFAFVRIGKACNIGALTFIAKNTGSPTGAVYVNIYRVDYAAAQLRFLYSFGDQSSQFTTTINPIRCVLPGPNNFAVSPGDVIAVEISGSFGLSSGQRQLYGQNIAIGNHPTALMKNIGGAITRGAPTQAAADVAMSSFAYSSLAPYIALEISTLPANYEPPVSTTYNTAGTYTHTLQTWLKAGDTVDLVTLGAGGGGGGFVSLSGYGGGGGAFGTRRLVVGTDIPVGTTSLTVTVGNGGTGAVINPSNGIDGGASSVTWSGGSVSGAGGAGGQTNAATSQTQANGGSPGAITFQGSNYFGGNLQTSLGANGYPPGGGGSGGWVYHSSGGTGSDGQVWVAEKQAA